MTAPGLPTDGVMCHRRPSRGGSSSTADVISKMNGDSRYSGRSQEGQDGGALSSNTSRPWPERRQAPTLGAAPLYHRSISALDCRGARPRPLSLERSVPLWIQALGLVAVAGGYALCFWAMAVNRFFSSVVRIQADRGQYVVTTGPYAYVRHPGYLGGILIRVASGAALGSWLAAVLLVVPSLPFLLHRAVTEDRVLIAELPGYCHYARRVRWRLLLGIW
jgi:protein-S-isoprenylcysteine O-methyltransferase Ste14